MVVVPRRWQALRRLLLLKYACAKKIGWEICSLPIARRVVQHGKTADAALLDEFLELTRMIGRSTAKKSPDATDVIDNERHTREFFYPPMNRRRAVSTPPQGLRPLVLAP
jgi:hypothetical protein